MTANQHAQTQVDIGSALTFQQQQQLNTTGELASLHWLDLGANVNAENQEQTIKQRLENLMQSHHALRTRFVKPQGFTTVRQYVETAELRWACSENSNTDALEAQAQIAFENEQAHLLAWFFPASELTPSSRLLLVGSSLALDDGTVAQIHQRLTHYDESLSLDIPEMQYIDYAQWIDELQQDDDVQEAVDFWHGFHLKDLPAIQLNERIQTSAGGLTEGEGRDRFNPNQPLHQHCSLSVSNDVQQGITRGCETLGASEELLSLSVWAILLNRLSDNNSLYIHRFHDSRDDYEELEGVMGVFSQALPTPFYDIDSLDLQRMLSGLAPLLEEQVDYQEYVQQLQVDNSVGFCFQLNEHSPSANHSMSSSRDLFLKYTRVNSGGVELQLHFRSDLYSSAMVERILRRYIVLLESALTQPNTPVVELPCLLDDEIIALEEPSADKKPSAYKQPSASNEPSAYKELSADKEPSASKKPSASKTNTKDVTHFLNTVYQHVLNTPKAQALRDGDTCYDYQQLWALSDTVAAELQQLGAQADCIVALCLPRAANFLVAMLGVMKTGAAYLPLDPVLPHRRIEQIINNANPVVVVSADSAQWHIGHEGTINAPLIEWSQLINSGAQLNEQLVAEKAHPKHLAYVLYTSGSTGVPKGVQVSYQAIMHYSESAIDDLQLPKEARYGLVSSLMADLGNTMIFPAWLQGGSLHLVPQKAVTDAQLFANYMLENQLDCLKIVPSHLLALLSGTPHDRVADVLPKQVLVLGGEGISDSLLTLLSQAQGNVEGNDSPTACRLYNHYGPTETTVGVLWRRIYLSKQYDKQTSLSHSIGQNRIYLLDNNFAPAVTGQIAELYVAGPSLTRGYLNAPTQTAQVYLPNPFSVNGARMYRTGDLAVQRADKSIDIIGRSDHQVKVRGFRLDLQEIETLLCQLPSVQQASIQIQGQGDAAQLIGFVVSDAPDTSNKDNLRTPTALKKWLAERLPDYMIPSQLWVMPQFPLNNNGKLDGKALLAWASKQQANSYVSPKTDTESVVAQIWQDILNIEKISTVDNFFDLGGHSLSAIKVVATLRESIGRELPTNVLFQAQTIKELALFIDEKINVTHLQTISTVNKKAPTVVLMHNRGGHLDDYQVLIDSLAPYTNLFGLYPDNEVLNNSQPSDIEPLLARYAEHLLPLKSQALIFVGWSLAARQIVVLSDYLRKHGFTIKSLALIDYNPNETLHHSGDELSQLLDDVGYYVEENHPQPLDNVLWQIMTTTLNDDGITTYEHGLKALLRLPELQGIVGGSLSIDLITERVLERWRLKKMFYSNSIPRVDLPLWVWNGHTNKANIDDWQAYSSHGIEAWEIDADHFTILQSPTLSDQLLDCINGAAQAKITL